MIAVAILAALLYTLPTFYGESPAVQVSSARSTIRVAPAVMARVQEALKSASIAYSGAALEQGTIRLRFEDTDTQLKAKDLVHATLNPGAAAQATPEEDPKVNYVVALNLLPASPHWLSPIPPLPMYLVLDFRAGAHFLLQVDMPAATTKRIESLAGDVRSQLREKGIRHGGVAREGQQIRIRFRDAAVRDQTRGALLSSLGEVTLADRDDGQDLLLVRTRKPEALK